MGERSPEPRGTTIDRQIKMPAGGRRPVRVARLAVVATAGRCAARQDIGIPVPVEAAAELHERVGSDASQSRTFVRLLTSR